jgi:hypothetical protein
VGIPRKLADRHPLAEESPQVIAGADLLVVDEGMKAFCHFARSFEGIGFFHIRRQ